MAITTKTRAEVIDDYKRDHKMRDPDSSIEDGEAVDIDARVLADQLMPLYANCKDISAGVLLKDALGQQLDEIGNRRGIPRLPESGATGYVEITASAAGGTIFAGDSLTETSSGLRFQCLTTALYNDGDAVPLSAIDTGPATNLAAGKVLQWDSPRPGIGPTATVIEQSDGSGLSGGRVVESDDDYRDRLEEAQSNPPASGNDAEVQLEVERTPGLAVQKCFTVPAILGPGTSCVMFTMKPARPGASRRPNGVQIATVEARITGLFPADDNRYFATIDQQPFDVVLAIDWSDAAGGWVDTVPWPEYGAPGAGAVVIDSVTDATHFVVATDDANYAGVAAPVVGQVFGLYNQTTGTFSRKRILTVGGGGPWTIVVDTSNQASDATYVPIVGQRVCPWADSLDALVKPVVAAVEKLGPGEQKATFFDAGLRQRRSPATPRQWPAETLARDFVDVLKLDEVLDGAFLEGLDVTAAVGTPGVLSYLLELGFLAAFPKN